VVSYVISCGPAQLEPTPQLSRTPSPTDIRCEAPPRPKLPKPAPPASHEGLAKIEHIVFVVQENRSFDHYFGTFPGADGLPRTPAGRFSVSVPDSVSRTCVKPFHDADYIDTGGPHDDEAMLADVNSGKMSGFLEQASIGSSDYCAAHQNDPTCTQLGSEGRPDVMGYKDEREIPNYWAYARKYVLADHFFSATISWSLPAHLYMVSGWSAACTRKDDPFSCTPAIRQQGLPYAWTDITYLLHEGGVSWRYYVAPGTEPDCEDNEMICTLDAQGPGTPNIWNPLPFFTTVREDGQLGNIQGVASYFDAAKAGTLPNVAWIVPSNETSEHPPQSVREGEAWVTELVNAVMTGPDWEDTAIFVFWDEWGGFYDHVNPPRIDVHGYGIRVPAILISPYAKRGYIDHQILSTDAYLKFIEDVFLGGRRLDPETDGRPDPRDEVRETVHLLGDVAHEFDFDQKPRAPLVLPPYPKAATPVSPPPPPPAP